MYRKRETINVSECDIKRYKHSLQSTIRLEENGVMVCGIQKMMSGNDPKKMERVVMRQ